MKPPQGEIKLSYGKDAAELYRGAMQRLIGKVYTENGVFPLRVAVTSGDGEAWSAVVTLTGRGSEFECKHSGTASLTDGRHRRT
jgi:hypothetical protein